MGRQLVQRKNKKMVQADAGGLHSWFQPVRARSHLQGSWSVKLGVLHAGYIFYELGFPFDHGWEEGTNREDHESDWYQT